MANTLKIKRSAVEGKTPLTTDLQLGEVAINTYDGKLFLKRNDGTNDFIVEVGGNVGYYVKNQSGSTIAKGTLVRFAGSLGSSGKLLIAPFIANNTYPSEYVMGIVLDDIVNGGDGFVVDHGKIVNFNTSGWADGTILYASATTAGALTSTQPVAPNNKVMVAAVVHSHASAGVLQIRITPGSKLNNDELVEISSPSNGQTLVYNSTSGRFENNNLTAAVYINTAAPSSPSVGDLWWNSEEGRLKIYYGDANTSQWVDAHASNNITAGTGSGMPPMFIQNTNPGYTQGAYLWIQTGTGDGTGITFWVEDGL